MTRPLIVSLTDQFILQEIVEKLTWRDEPLTRDELKFLRRLRDRLELRESPECGFEDYPGRR
jgi:hypothetical protein